jgi:hypothetical protein
MYEALGRHLSGEQIDIVIHPFDGTPVRASYNGTSIDLIPCDPKVNARTRRPEATPTPKKTIDFDPAGELLRRSNNTDTKGQRP